MEEEDLKDQDSKNEFPLVNLLGKSSLETIGRIAGRDYIRKAKIKEKNIRIKKTTCTFLIKLLMEEMPKGRLYGR